VLASAPPGYQLNVADADCDLGRFVTEKNAGVHAAAAGRFEDASGYLSAALAQWRGPFLDDLREFAFVDTFATALSEVRVAVQTALAEAEIACGRADAVIPRLEVLSVVIDTGGSFVTSDLRWTNGVQVQGRRIRSSATLADGDHIRIGGHEFTFDIRPR
jgi:hypothetical protein